MAIDSRVCVVIGGKGFVGRSLVGRLLKVRDWVVRIADSAQSLQLDPSADQDTDLAEALAAGRLSYFHVDVRDKHQIIRAVEGSSVVFHVETSTTPTQDFYVCYTLVVQGAKNIINACRECKVKRLIYSSSADVVFDGSHDIHNGDESLPYAWKFEDMLSDLKAQAEALILFANDIDGLLTCVLRPSNVFGPGDTEIIPFIVNHAKYGWSKFIIGSGENMSDFTYVENVAHALICAEEALSSRMVSVSGKVFFITNLDSIKFWDFISLVLEGLGYQRAMIKIPSRLVWYVVLFIKWMDARMDSRRLFKKYPLVHKFVQLALRTRTFNCSAAQAHLGYSPVVSLEEGIMFTIQSFSHLASDKTFSRDSEFDEPSKVDKLLGSGKVADILLWRDDRKSFACFLVLLLLYYWFFFSGRTFVSSAALLLLVITVSVSGYGILSTNIFGFNQRISLSCFEISEVDMMNLVKTITIMWNKAVHVTRALAQGEDWNLFFKVAGSLYILKWIVSYYLTAAIGIGLALAFTALCVYEQYEEVIDGIAKFFFYAMKEALTLLVKNLPISVPSLSHNSNAWQADKRPPLGSD
ncbi:3beta-hydroxysteroid-dehydrogenase/decarboxylase [Diospyros lotus]|uniref:3beta-hydroxysteroid- dehydrogenase/decarboxylase n=1 Tax=Diospyros lotus TaxID=55363 RepID=UPI00224F2DA5|nr:3beta-hydroxysteroid-dehydrogenase/decarboxylase [Diospyros lotus]